MFKKSLGSLFVAAMAFAALMISPHSAHASAPAIGAQAAPAAVQLNCGYTYIPKRLGQRPPGYTQYDVYYRNCMWYSTRVQVTRWLAPSTGCTSVGPQATKHWVFGSTYGIGSPSGIRFC